MHVDISKSSESITQMGYKDRPRKLAPDFSNLEYDALAYNPHASIVAHIPKHKRKRGTEVVFDPQDHKCVRGRLASAAGSGAQ